MSKVRVADFIAQTLQKHGVRHVFMLTGGGAMHLNDAFGRVEGMSYVCCHHEQALAMAADSYSRLSNRLACVNVTTGPGGINTLNGVFGAYTDSIPMIIVSGQSKRELVMQNSPVPLRQIGDQEVNIVDMVHTITKYAVMVDNPADIRFIMEKAIWLATTGRPGPTWVDVPIDVQAAPIDPDTLRGFDPIAEGYGREYAVPQEFGRLRGQALTDSVAKVLERIKGAKRPVILAGMGVRLSGGHEKFLELVERLGVPVVTGWNAHDIHCNDQPTYAGRPGSIGDRAGNFTVQNSDAILVLGSRLNIRQVSYNYQCFARAAYKMMVDIDRSEMAKQTLQIDMPVHADLDEFLEEALAQTKGYKVVPAHSEYLKWARERVARYPTVLPQYWETKGIVNPYCFVDMLFGELKKDDIVVTGDGTACVVTFQAAKLKQGQRLFTNSGSASMGFDLPAAIGAAVAEPDKRIVCIAGDGSIMQNIQELQTIIGLKLNVKIIVLNNFGYHSIRQAQQAYFNGYSVGCGPDSGLSFPDLSKVTQAFGFHYRSTSTHDEMQAALLDLFKTEGPGVLEVMIDKSQTFMPRTSSRRLEDGSMVSAPLEDLAPFLPRDEFAENMLIPPLK